MEDNTLDLFEIDHSKYGDAEASEEVTSVVSNDDVPEKEDVSSDVKPVAVEDSTENDDATDVSQEKDLDVKEEKEAVAENSDGSEESSEELGEFGSVISSLVSNNIVDYNEDDEYEESEKGIGELIKNTVDARVNAGVNEYKESLSPKSKQFLEYMENGGSIEEFKEDADEVDFSSLALVDEKGNELTQRHEYLVEDLLKIQGYTDEEIKDTVAGYKDAGMLYKQADIAKRKLAAHQTATREQRIQEREKAKVEAEQKKIEESKQFQDKVLSTRSIGDFNISETQAKKLHNFITVKDSSGKTSFEKVNTEENSLLYAFFAMEGFNKEKLTKEIKTKQAIKLKKKLSNYKDSQTKPTRGGANAPITKSDSKIHWEI